MARKPRLDSPWEHKHAPRTGGSGGDGRRRWTSAACTAAAAVALVLAALGGATWLGGAAPAGQLLLLSPRTLDAVEATAWEGDAPSFSRKSAVHDSAASLFDAGAAPVRPAALSRIVERWRGSSGGGGASSNESALTAGAGGEGSLQQPAGEPAAAEKQQLKTPQDPAQPPQPLQQLKAPSESSAGSASGGPEAAPAPVQAAAAEGACRPSLLVMLTSHKTGTAQAGCITEMVEQRYVTVGAERHDHHPPDLHAVSAFAAAPLPAQFSGVGSSRVLSYCPSVKAYSSGHHLPRLEDAACPGTLPCPCQGEQEQCLATDAGTLDIPGGNTTVIQVIREPTNVVLSAYQYHLQDPPPEEWLTAMTMSNFSGWMYSGGVPYEALDDLGAHSAPTESFHSFLRRLPHEQGVKLQFWMSAWELYGFARQYASLAQQAQQAPGLRFMPVRFEDLQDRYNETARGVLEAFRERLPQLDVARMLREVQACHLSTWNRAHLAAHEHITNNRDPELRQALRGVLTSDPEIAPRLCQLSRIFGYDSGPACSVEAPASGTASPGGSSTGGEGVAQEGPGLVQLIGSRGDGGDA